MNDIQNLDDTIWQLFEVALAGNAQREAVVDPLNRAELCGGEAVRWTFGELHRAALGIAALLHEQGVGEGDRVLVQLPNIAELVVVYLAVARLGAIISPVPMQYRAHELRSIVSATEPRAAFSVQRFKDTSPADTLQEVLAGQCPLYLIGDAAGELNRDSLLKRSPLSPDIPLGKADDIYTLCWTSGTTGTPKAVPRRHHHWLAMLPVFEDATALPEGATMLAPFPMVNMAAISTFIVYWLQVKGRLVLHHPMDLPVFLRQIALEKAAYTVAPPALLTLILTKPEILKVADFSSLRVIGSGSAPLAPSMISGFKEKFGIDIVNMFGSNEGCCLVADARDVPDPVDRATCFPRFGHPRFGWSNRMANSLRTRLLDTDTGEIIDEPAWPGELLIKGPTVFEGYWQSDADNRKVFDSEGYFHTGDLFEITGTRDEFYRFVGRHKDIIVRGGMKISPEELDQLLAGHPDIAEAAVVGVPDEILGHKICAVVVPKGERTPSLDSLRDYLCERGLAQFKLPESLQVREQLPRNPLGKVIRRELV